MKDQLELGLDWPLNCVGSCYLNLVYMHVFGSSEGFEDWAVCVMVKQVPSTTYQSMLSVNRQTLKTISPPPNSPFKYYWGCYYTKIVSIGFLLTCKELH